MDKKIASLREKIGKFIGYCEDILKMPEPNINKGFLEAKKIMIGNMWNKIDAAYDGIVEDADEEEVSLPYLKKDHENAFQTLDKTAIRIQTKLEKHTPIAPPLKLPENLVLNANDKPNIKLKAMDIPIFYGDYDKWISFRNMFDSLVHDKPYQEVEKIHYLKSCLKGEAERVISQYDIKAESYQPAYAALVERFHNKGILVDTHIINILAQPNLTSESGDDLKEMLDVTSVNLQALNSLEIQTDTWDPILLLLLVQKLDGVTRRLWEQTLKPKESPTMKAFLEFIKARFHALGCQQKFNFTIEPKTNNVQYKAKSSFKTNNFRRESASFPPRVHQNFHTTTDRDGKCPFRCMESHEAVKCGRFSRADATTRQDLVTCARLCKNCLKPHSGRCMMQPGCKKCGMYHHEALHMDMANSFRSDTSVHRPNQPASARTTDHPSSSANVASHHVHIGTKSSRDDTINSDVINWDESVLLSTAIVLVLSKRDNRFYAFRALLDDASEASYASEYLVQTLGLKKRSVLANSTGLGGVTTGQINNIVDFTISSKQNPSFSMKIEGPVTNKITQPLPSNVFKRKEWNHIKDLPLADPQFYIPAKIDLLLGASVYGYLMLPGLVKASPQEPVARNTEFGWILSGPVRESVPNIASFHLKIDVDNQLKRFFEQEEISKERIFTKEEAECENFYMETYERREDGRFVVALPFKQDPESIGSSRGQAISRLSKLEERFSTNNQLKGEYTDILKEYEILGHTTDLGQLEGSNNDDHSYYLPHHAVFKPESTSTKTRIVFDASAKGTKKLSLNDVLMTGPMLQQELISILMRWRVYCYILAADIKKMYRQIEVREADRQYQKFLFRKEGAIHVFQHNRVTFGVTTATYLAVKSLQQLAYVQRRKYPQAAEVVRKDFYMDDVMSGADTEEMCTKLCSDVTELLANGKFELSKFISNSEKVLESIPEADREIKLPMEIDLSNTVKTLGVHYHPTSDIFQFRVNLKVTSKWPTKRSLLSEASRLFDPLGWLAPVVIRAKILFQKLWVEGLTWDQRLPEIIADEWIKFRSELHVLETLRVERWIGKGLQTIKFELHGFSDASEDGYSAGVYSRNIDADGTIRIYILASKTRVAPLKQETLPRLELCGLVLLINLLQTVQKALVVPKENIHAWTDSMIVLGWINTNPAKLKTYVANRVVEINNFLDGSQCHHIPGSENPADCASRGINPNELINHELWWHGPAILKENRSSWKQQLEIPPATLELKKKSISTNVTSHGEDLEIWLRKYSSFNRLLRVLSICSKFLDKTRNTKVSRTTALCLTFINNLRARSKKPQLIITAEDLERSKIFIVKWHQQKEFQQEIDHLAKGHDINKKSRIITLHPFLDNEGCLRVGGRLSEADLPYERKHPLILAPGRLTYLIIAETHEASLHGGIKLTINLIREKFWILNLRTQVKKYIYECVKCSRFKKGNNSQIMADLPRVRVNMSAPFTHVGLDYAGPYDLKASNVRSPPIRIRPTMIEGQIVKSIPKVPVYEGYIALFVCMATKAVHIEVVSDKTTEAFLAAYDRFTARKGFPECCYSDNASTFIGAKSVLAPEPEDSMLEFNVVNTHASKNGTLWEFIPPRTPHQGGIWEAGIKSMKHHLKRVIGSNVLTFEEMSTITARIEACLNSRPLCTLNDDPDELMALTPGHFLIGRPLLARPDRKFTSKNFGARERWRLAQKIQQDFWKSWNEEYLNELQNRQKWQLQERNFERDDVVLLKEDNVPQLKWPIARIVDIHPSKDQKVRTVTVRTHNENGKVVEWVRPIVKLRLLPTRGDTDDTVDIINGRTN